MRGGGDPPPINYPFLQTSINQLANSYFISFNNFFNFFFVFIEKCYLLSEVGFNKYRRSKEVEMAAS